MRESLRRRDIDDRTGREVETELAEHLERHFEELLEAGWTAEAAEARMLEELESEATAASLSKVLGRASGSRWTRLLAGSNHDLRLAVRRLVHRPLFAFAAVATMAIALGANTLVFSVVNDVLLQPLPFQDPDRLYLLSQRTGEVAFPQLSFPDYQDLRDGSEIFADAAALWIEAWTISDLGRSERVGGLAVTPNLMDVLGIQPVLGRGPGPQDLAAETPVALVSNGFWASRLGGTAAAVGSPLTLDGVRYTIIGVLPPEFSLEIPIGPTFMIPEPEVLTLIDPASSQLQSRSFSSFEVIARARPGLTQAAIDEGLRLESSRLEAAYPASNQGRTFEALPLLDHVVADTRPLLLVLWGSVAAVLLIACANLAGLLMSQSQRRAREMQTRLALGATAGKLARQELAAAAVLAALGAALGCLLAWWGQPLILSLAPPDIPRLNGVGFGWEALLFCAVLTVLTLGLFALQPLAGLTRTTLLSTATGTRVAAGLSPLRRALVVAQFSLTFILLAGSLLFTTALYSLSRLPTGFDTNHLYTFGLSLSSQRYPETELVLDFYGRLRSELEAVPGVERVGFVSSLPLSGHNTGSSVRVEGKPLAPGEQPPDIGWQVVLPGYFEAMRIPLLAGRDFGTQDGRGGPHRTIINESLARLVFGDEEPLGRRLSFGPGQPEWHEVVGVVADIRHLGIDQAPGPRAYDLYGQHGGYSMRAVVRSGQAADELVRTVRTTVQALDGEIPVTSEFTMAEIIRQETAVERFMATLSTLFAVMAAVVAAFGIYSVLSLLVGQRRHEIGIRQAVGATAADIGRIVFEAGGTLVGAGLVLGAAAVWYLTRFLEPFLPGGLPNGVGLLAAAAGLLLVIGLAGCLVPALRATRVDPLACLRGDS